MIIICRNSFWVKVNLVKLHSLQLMQCRHPGSQAKAAAASSNREGKEKMKNDDFFVGKKWNRSRSSSKNSIHFCCQRNSIKKREGDLNYFNFKSWKLSFHLSKKFSFTRFASNIWRRLSSIRFSKKEEKNNRALHTDAEKLKKNCKKSNNQMCSLYFRHRFQRQLVWSIY